MKVEGALCVFLGIVNRTLRSGFLQNTIDHTFRYSKYNMLHNGTHHKGLK